MRRKTDTLLVIVALVALWQVLHWIVGSVALTSPADTLARAVELLGSATFWPHVAETGVALLYSLLLAVLGGLTIGIALGINGWPARWRSRSWCRSTRCPRSPSTR